MKKQKSIQVPVEFLAQTYLLVDKLEELDAFYELGSRVLHLCERLRFLIDEKFAAMNRRNSFTGYITALPGSSEREALRRAYLDLASIHTDWCSDSESLEPDFNDDVPF